MKRVLFVVCCVITLCSGFRNESVALRCGQNEITSCVKECPPERTCRNRDIEFNCLEDPRPCTKTCICAEGYFRNSIGECITGAQCDKCNRKNEFYSCNNACDNECDKIDRQNRTNCPIRNIQCNKWCYCDDGYARDAKKNCVPVEKCPKPTPCKYPRSEPSCPENEEFTCKKSCPPETCISIVALFKCDSNEECQPRCACKPGFLRLKSGSPCVPTCQCKEIANSPECKEKQTD